MSSVGREGNGRAQRTVARAKDRQGANWGSEGWRCWGWQPSSQASNEGERWTHSRQLPTVQEEAIRRIRLEGRVLVNLACPVAAVADDSQAHREDGNV